MAYKFTERTNNKQQQTTYVLYMIISSYFHKSICSNEVLETMLRLYYRDMSESCQEKLEERVITSTERKLKEVLSSFSVMNCEVFIRHQDGNFYLDFKTGFESVSVVVDRNAKYRIQMFDESIREGWEFA